MCWLDIHFHITLHQNTLQYFKMSSVQEMQRVDRELFSELIESPINPAFLHMFTPRKNDHDPMFYLELNGEALWQWRHLKSPDQIFHVLQDNLLGYRLSPCCRHRVGLALYSRMHYLTNKLRNIKCTVNRKAARSQYWCSIVLHPEEISQAPEEIIVNLREDKEKLIIENQRLTQELEGNHAKCLMQFSIHLL